MRNVSANIPKLYLIHGLRWFLLVMPIIVLFFRNNGLNMTQVFVLQSVFSVGLIVFEIPSGYFSDVVGRRITIIIGCVLGFIGFLVYALSYGFWGFLIAELILGLGGSFISGTDSALLYDSLAQIGRAGEYQKIEGRVLSVCHTSEGIAAIAGGLLATISLRTPLYVETAFCLLAVPVALTLVEPERRKFQHAEGNWAGILHIVKYAMHGHPQVKWLIIYSSVVGASTLTAVWFIQPYLQAIGLPLPLFGVVWAGLQFSVGIFALIAYRFESLIGRRRTIISLILLSATGYTLISVTGALWGMVFLILFYFVRGINEPVMRDYINRHITSEMRATVLSVRGLIGRLIFSVLGILAGAVSDRYSLPTALAACGAVFLALGIVSLNRLARHNAL